MKLKTHHKIALGIATAVIATTVGYSYRQQIVPNLYVPNRIGPSEAYPNSELTTGKADTLKASDLTKQWSDNCPSQTPCTYSQDHRNVPSAEHQQVYDEYSVPIAEQNIKNGEIDHFYPLCAGGSNDISNLWYMPISIPWNGEDMGYKTKDKLETWICVQIKSGAMSPQDAYTQLTTDWVKMYEDNKASITHQPVHYGGVVYDYDGDE